MTTTPNIVPPATPQPRPGQLAIFLDLITFAHSIFALPFALIATFWAFRMVGWQQFGGALGVGGGLALILVCMVAARTWAMTFNRLIDRRLHCLFAHGCFS